MSRPPPVSALLRVCSAPLNNDLPHERMDATVVICTHNPRETYLRRCLDGLRAQTLDRQRWEMLLVDNHSDRPLADRVDVSWHPGARLLREERLGLTPARLRAIREAAGAILVFVDDDNVLDGDFLEAALHVANEKPFLGSWSGQCRPEFEEPPPAWTRRYWGNLVIREFDEDVWSNLPRLAESMPCGAGLCVRLAVAQRYAALHDSGQRLFQFDRTGTSLLSGGDNDLAGCACILGQGVGLVASMKLTHLIPRERLTEEYLARLAEGIHFSSTLLDAAYGSPLQRRGLLGAAVDFARTLRVKPPHRRILRAAYRGRDRALRELARAGDAVR